MNDMGGNDFPAGGFRVIEVWQLDGHTYYRLEYEDGRRAIFTSYPI